MPVYQGTSGETTDLIISVHNQENREFQANSAPVGALATRKGNFSTFLAPLTQDTFKQVVKDVEQK
ncbi:MAG: hypothetical protein ACYT04_67790, partial [Nostoc sp.]